MFCESEQLVGIKKKPPILMDRGLIWYLKGVVNRGNMPDLLFLDQRGYQSPG
jgi:hypothetical protein